MSAANVLNEAISIIYEREHKYGEFDVTAIRTAAMQSILHEEPRHPEGWLLDMVVTKLARIYSSPDHLDNYIDAICYLAQAAAMQQQTREVE